MAAGRIGVGSMFRWLGDALALCRRHPGTMFGAALVLLLAAMLPTLAQLLFGALLPGAGPAAMVAQVLASLLALLVFPPVVGGFYRLVHALHEGRDAHALDLLAVYRDRPAARRLIATNLVFVLISILVIAGLAVALGGQPLLDFLRVLATLKPGATQLPAVPAGLPLLLALLLLLALVIMSAQGLATAQVALADGQPLPSVATGFRSALRHVGAFLLFYLPIAVVGFIAFMVLALVAALLAAMLSVISPALAGLVLVPIALLAVLVLYALMFTFFYYAWREILGGDAAAPRNDQIAA